MIVLVLLAHLLIAIGWVKETFENYASQFVTPRGAG